jgi:Predicted protease
MKQRHLVLCVSITAALASLPAIAQTPAAASTNAALADLAPAATARVTQVVDNRVLVTIPRSQVPLLARVAPTGVVPDGARMEHLQLILKRSAQQQAALDGLIRAQQDPASAKYHHWVTPQEYGRYFGLAPADLHAVTAWLVAQGFRVNGVYPSGTDIDFSGTAGQVRAAFHTQEAHYLFNGEQHVANDSDIRIPAALKDVVAGVAGLTDIHPRPMHVPPQRLVWDAAKHAFKVKSASVPGAASKPQPQTASLGFDVRGLSPYDMSRMYNVAPLLKQGITGKGVTIAVIEDQEMVAADWDQFRSAFGLAGYGGSFAIVNPPPAGIATDNCYALPAATWGESPETVLDAEWSTAMAPGAHVEVASCADFNPADGSAATTNFFGGVYIAGMNLVNGTSLPDIISASYGYDEEQVPIGSKLADDGMWQQAAAEGISVFVSSGDSGVNAGFNGSSFIYDYGISPNSFASSPYVTAVGGTDTADILDGSTSTYFSAQPNKVFGSALSYVPEIPWNQSCGNGAAAKDFGFANALAFCQFQFKVGGPNGGTYFTAEGSSGGPSALDDKPAWQSLVHGAASDGVRDIPDVALFGGSYGGYTWALLCMQQDNCAPGLPNGVEGEAGTSLSSPMFAGIQALVDQALGGKRQGVAAATLYPLAAKEYGSATGKAPASLAACNADNGIKGTAACVFHNVTRGGISTNCYNGLSGGQMISTPDCYNYVGPYGLMSTGAGSYAEAYPAQPGWSFASGLGSVNAANLVKAWKAYAAAKK